MTGDSKDRVATAWGLEPVWAPGELEQLTRSLHNAGKVSFRERLKIAGLEPESDLRHGNWSGISFDGEDLRGFDFTGSNLSGCTFRSAQVAGAIFEGADVDLIALDEAIDEEGMLNDEVRLLNQDEIDSLLGFGLNEPLDENATLSPTALRLAFLAVKMKQHRAFGRMFASELNAPGELIARLSSRPDKQALGLSEFVEIVATKNARSPGGASVARKHAEGNDKSSVRIASEAAFTKKDPLEAIEPLLELKGVGVATASAILSWCEPDKWPVIDRHALGALAKFKLLPERPADRVPEIAEWLPFVTRVKQLRAILGWTPQEIDRWLYAFDKCQLDPEDLDRPYGDEDTRPANTESLGQYLRRAVGTTVANRDVEQMTEILASIRRLIRKKGDR